MRSQCWRACILLALFRSPKHGEWVADKQMARKGSAGVVVAASLQHGLATPYGGGGQGHRAGQEARALFPLYVHTGAGLTQENWQSLSTIDQWLTSQALPLVIGGDFQVEPKQLEDSGWVRTVCGFVEAKLATVTPSHRVIDFFVVSREHAGAWEATSHISHHIAPLRPVRIVVSTADTTQDAGDEQAKALASGQAKWLQEAGACPGLDPVRRRVQAAAERRRGGRPSSMQWRRNSSTRFLMVPEEADAFCGRSQGQKLVWKACKSP